MNKMLVAVFDNDQAAYQGLSSMKELHRNGDISLFASAVIEKDEEGNISTKQAASDDGMGVPTGLLTGSLIGLLAGPGGMLVGASLGSLTGLLFDMRKVGIDVDFATEVSDAMSPGKVAILADIDEGWTTPLDTTMAEAGGMLFRRLRSEVVEEQINREVDETLAEMDELEKELDESAEDAKASIKNQMDLLSKKMATIQETAQSRIQHLTSETDAKMGALKTQLEEASERKKEKIEKRIYKLKTDSDQRLAKLKASLDRSTS